MALTSTEEALTRQLIAQSSALLSLAGNEPSITSKLGATEVSLSDLTAASSVNTTDLLLTRQGTTDKSLTALLLKNFMASQLAGQFVDVAGDTMTGALALVGDSTATTQAKADNTTKIATTAHVKSVVADYLTTASALATYLSQSAAASTYAPLASPSFTGNPLAPTPALFDNDTSVATTAFVQRALGNMQGCVGYAGSATLTSADVGKFHFFNSASNLSATLPDASAIVAGGAMIVVMGGSGGTLTLNAAASQNIANSKGVNASSLVMQGGDTVLLVRYDASTWIVAGGSIATLGSSQFDQTAGSSCYFKVGKKIIQMGLIGFGSSSGQTVTFPIAFPTACRSFVATAFGANSGGADVVEYSSNATQTSVSVQLSNATTNTAVSGYLYFIAIGD